MPDSHAHRVFLSSPGDVQTERDAADAVLTGLQRSAAWRGKFTFDVVRWDDPAAPVPMDAHLTPQQAVDTGRPKPSECDITVVILWSRMGTPLEHQGRRYLSGTEYEYEDARRGEGRLLLYRRTDKPQLDIDDRAFEEKRQQYQSVNQFFERFTAADGTLTGGYTPYEGVDAFAPRFRQDIEAILRQVDSAEAQPPDVAARSVSPTRFISYSGLPDSGGFLFGREQELKLLDGAWANTSTNVLSLVAWGGVGKSALVNHWLATMAKEHYRGTQRVFGWSFHNQGTRETATSADLFFTEALQQFGDGDPKAGTPKDRAKRLIRLVQEERSLLILDGLEPLQHPPGHGDKGGGDLKDPALATLVRALAADNPGLCILTTRLSIKELQTFIGATALVIELEHLSATAGAALLAALDVQGAQGELEKASTEFAGHSLALNLLGTYLRDICGGDVSRRGEIPLRDEDKEYGGHAWQMLASYEEWFGEGPELTVLRLLGLFDRPAEGKLLDVLRKPPSIADLTKTLVELKSSDQWQRVLARLRKARLLAMADARDPDAYDIHPLVREYFGSIRVSQR